MKPKRTPCLATGPQKTMHPCQLSLARRRRRAACSRWIKRRRRRPQRSGRRAAATTERRRGRVIPIAALGPVLLIPRNRAGRFARRPGGRSGSRAFDDRPCSGRQQREHLHGHGCSQSGGSRHCWRHIVQPPGNSAVMPGMTSTPAPAFTDCLLWPGAASPAARHPLGRPARRIMQAGPAWRLAYAPLTRHDGGLVPRTGVRVHLAAKW